MRRRGFWGSKRRLRTLLAVRLGVRESRARMPVFRFVGVESHAPYDSRCVVQLTADGLAAFRVGAPTEAQRICL